MQIVEVETEVKPCPFCGAKAVVKTEKTPYYCDMEEHYWVKCSNTDCSVSPASYPNLEAAITRWNTRAA
jgi:Lar family restriction alleviation protein